MFRGRTWPEGYEFPACSTCQTASSKEELLVALLARMHPSGDGPTELQEFEGLLRGVQNNFPGIVETLNLTANQKKTWLKRRHLELEPGQTAAELPLAALKDSRFESAVITFARKLFLALYYKHTGQPIPLNGGARFRWWTNAQDLSVLKSSAVQQLLNQFPQLRRQATNLSDQFDYRFATPVDNPRLYAFLVSFNTSFVMLGMTSTHIADIANAPNTLLIQPYQ